MPGIREKLTGALFFYPSDDKVIVVYWIRGLYFMELNYTYQKGEMFLVGHLDDYPEYPTQGEDIQDLEEHLKEIFSWIQDGTIFS